MTRSLPLLLLAPVAALAAPASSFPMHLQHQGRLIDATTGAPVDGSHDVTFEIHDAPAGGVARFTETITLEFDGGYFSALLGADTANALAPDDLAGERWLSVALDGGPSLTRLPIAAVPWAVHADTARNVSGGSVDAVEIKVNGATVISASGAVSASWNDLADIPADLADGDALDALSCGDGELLAYTSGAWGCLALADLTLDADAIVAGTLDVVHLPVGTGSGHVAAGDHAHTAADVGALPIGGGTLTGGLVGAEASFSGGVQVGTSETCDDGREGTVRWADGALQVCDGADWLRLRVVGNDDGSSAGNPGETCRGILRDHPASTSGTYWIDPDGAGALKVYCNMSDQGGGWTLVARMTENCFTDMRAAAGSVEGPTQSACAKLSDAKINAIRTAPSAEGVFWGWQGSTQYAMPATGRFMRITKGEFNASDHSPSLEQQCSCVAEGPWSGSYNAHGTMAGVYNHSGGAWQCTSAGSNGCTSAHVYSSALFLYQHSLHQAGTFPSNSHGVPGGSAGWLYLR